MPTWIDLEWVSIFHSTRKSPHPKESRKQSRRDLSGKNIKFESLYRSNVDAKNCSTIYEQNLESKEGNAARNLYKNFLTDGQISIQKSSWRVTPLYPENLQYLVLIQFVLQQSCQRWRARRRRLPLPNVSPNKSFACLFTTRKQDFLW